MKSEHQIPNYQIWLRGKCQINTRRKSLAKYGSLVVEVQIAIDFEPPYDVLSLLHQSIELTLTITKNNNQKGLFAKIASRFSSKFFRNVSKLSWD